MATLFGVSTHTNKRIALEHIRVARLQPNELERKQLEFQTNFKKQFKALSCSATYLRLLDILARGQYKFETLDRSDASTIVKFISNSQTGQAGGKTNALIIFDRSLSDMTVLAKGVVDQCIKYGDAIIVKDTQGRICGFLGFIDCYEAYSKDTDPHQHASNRNARYSQIFELATKDFLVKRLNILEYGEYMRPLWLTVHPTQRRKGIALILKWFLNELCMCLGYKYSFGISTNTLTRTRRNLELIESQTQLYDFSKYKFNDGSTMSEYFDNFENKYNYSKAEMNDIRNNCIMEAILRDYRRVNKHVFDQRIIEIAQQYSIKNTTRKLHPKL